MDSNTAGQTGKTSARVTEVATIATGAGAVIAQTRRVDLTASTVPDVGESIKVGDRCERAGEIVTVEALTDRGGAYITDRNGMRWLVNASTLTPRPDISEADVLAARYPERDGHGYILAYYVRSHRGRRGPYAYRATAEALPRFPEDRVVVARLVGANGRAVRAPQNH